MKKLLIILFIVSALAVYQRRAVPQTPNLVVSPVAAPATQSEEEVFVVVEEEEAVLPPAPPAEVLGDITVGTGDVSFTVDTPAPPKPTRAVPSKPREDRKAKELDTKRIGYTKELAELRGKLATTTLAVTALEGDLRAVNNRYKAQEDLEHKRRIIRGDRARALPDGESKRLIDRDWNVVNKRLNTAYAYRNRLVKEIEKLEEKLAAVR